MQPDPRHLYQQSLERRNKLLDADVSGDVTDVTLTQEAHEGSCSGLHIPDKRKKIYE